MEDSTEGYGTEYSDYEVKVKVGDSLIDVFKKIISNYYEELETNSSISPESTIFFENIKFILDELKNKGNLFRENFLTSVIAASIWEQSCPSKEINYGINV